MTATGTRDLILTTVATALKARRPDADPVDVASVIVESVQLREMEVREEVAATIEARAAHLRGHDTSTADAVRQAFCDGMLLGAKLARGGDRV